MFFLIPAAYASIVGVIVLIASLIIKKLHKRSTALIPTYIGMLIGVGTIVYSIKVVRGFEGAGIGLIGLTIILESLIILLYLLTSKKDQNNLVQ